MQIEKRIGREKKRCGYAPFNSAQQAIKLRSLRSLRPSGKLPSATCFIAGPLGGIENNAMIPRNRTNISAHNRASVPQVIHEGVENCPHLALGEHALVLVAFLDHQRRLAAWRRWLVAVHVAPSGILA